ncbi:MAG: hypothetical protein WKF58_16085 [Ilumatobacteraceae bacterium]
MIQRRCHGGVVGVEQAVVAGQRPPHRQRLRRRERRIEPRHRLDHPAIRGEPVQQLTTKRRPVTGSQPDSSDSSASTVTGPDKPEAVRLTTGPLPRRLTRRRGQVLRVVRRRRRRRRRMQSRHPQHRTEKPARPPAGTCLNSQ